MVKLGSPSCQYGQRPCHVFYFGRVTPCLLQATSNGGYGVIPRLVFILHQGGPASQIANQVIECPSGMHGEIRAFDTLKWKRDLAVPVLYMPALSRPVGSKHIEIKAVNYLVNSLDRKKVVGQGNQWRPWQRYALDLCIKRLEIEPVKRLGNKRQANRRAFNGRRARALTTLVDGRNRRRLGELWLTCVGSNDLFENAGQRSTGLPASATHVPYCASSCNVSQPVKESGWVGWPEVFVGISLTREIRHTYSPYLCVMLPTVANPAL